MDIHRSTVFDISIGNAMVFELKKYTFLNYKTCYIRQPVCAIVTQALDEFDQTVPSRHHRICINGLLVLSNVEYIGKQSSDVIVPLG